MFRCSHNLNKFITSLPAHQTDNITRAILGLFDDFSRRKLHSLTYCSFRGRCKIVENDCRYLRKIYIYPKRDFIWPSLFSKGRNSNPVSRGSSDKSKDLKDLGKLEEIDKISTETCPYENRNQELSDKKTKLNKVKQNYLNNDDNQMGKNLLKTKNVKDTFYGAQNADRENLIESKIGGENEAAKVANGNKQQKSKSPNILLVKAKNLLRKSSKTDDQNQIETPDSGTNKTQTSTPRKRQLVDLNKCSTERNFITPVRAMTDFLLKPSDLEGLRKTKRRSPYENDPPITVYWRKDVEAKAIDIWGSKENLLKEILKRDIEKRRYQQNIFTVKRRLRDYRREQGRETEFNSKQGGLSSSTGRAVLFAICINALNAFGKVYAWYKTGSSSIFSEGLHSLADTMNQLILAYGIRKSVQRADSDHPYGYTNMSHVTSLISGVAIFFIGSGLSMYHGVATLINLKPVESYSLGLYVLAGSFILEGATLLIALKSAKKSAEKAQMRMSEYVLRGIDPSINVVILEDTAGVLGVLVASCSMGLSVLLNSPIPDGIGSLVVGVLLTGVASFIVFTNGAALVGRSIPQPMLDKINAELESDVMIRAIHDVKGIYIGNSLIRYKAEIDFDGGELTRSYLDKQDLNQLLKDVKSFKTIDELEEFMLKHGENIVDMMGGEIDRIELKLRKKHPDIRHCDLEIL